MISKIGEGILGGEYYALTLENEGLLMEFDKDFEVGDELMAVAEETITGIISGDIVPIPEDEDDEEDSED